MSEKELSPVLKYLHFVRFHKGKASSMAGSLFCLFGLGEVFTFFHWFIAARIALAGMVILLISFAYLATKRCACGQNWASTLSSRVKPDAASLKRLHLKKLLALTIIALTIFSFPTLIVSQHSPLGEPIAIVLGIILLSVGIKLIHFAVRNEVVKSC